MHLCKANAIMKFVLCDYCRLIKNIWKKIKEKEKPQSKIHRHGILLAFLIFSYFLMYMHFATGLYYLKEKCYQKSYVFE